LNLLLNATGSLSGEVATRLLFGEILIKRIEVLECVAVIPFTFVARPEGQTVLATSTDGLFESHN
jgi:hypothetical protein